MTVALNLVAKYLMLPTSGMPLSNYLTSHFSIPLKVKMGLMMKESINTQLFLMETKTRLSMKQLKVIDF